jgi:hypothetical protein
VSSAPSRAARQERGAAHHGLRQQLPLVIALTIVTLTGTAVTYQALRIQARANGADAQSVAETLNLATRQVNAEIAARAYERLAGQYVIMLSKAEAIAKTDPVEAALQRQSAQDFAILGGFAGYLKARSGKAAFDYDFAYRTELRRGDVAGVPTERPGITAARADRDHDRVRVLALAVVGLLGVIVLITLARINSEHRRRLLFGGGAAAAYAGLVLVASQQVW